MSEEHKYASPSAVQVKNWQKTISTEEKLDVISQLEKVVRLPQSFLNEPYQKIWVWVSYIFIVLEINKYII